MIILFIYDIDKWCVYRMGINYFFLIYFKNIFLFKILMKKIYYYEIKFIEVSFEKKKYLLCLNVKFIFDYIYVYLILRLKFYC